MDIMKLRRNRRFVAVVLALHLCILYLIYNYVPQGRKVDLLDEKNPKIPSGDDVTKDPFKLNWDSNARVFYKKVRGHRNDVNVEAPDENKHEEKSKECSYKDRNTRQFVKILNDLFIYSSYLDNRTGVPEIRSIIMFKSNSTPEADALLWCHFKIPNSRNYPAYATSRARFYEMCENHKKKYGGYIMSCLLPSDIKITPNIVKIGYGESRLLSLQNSTEICVTSRDKNVVRRKLDFGVCVPPLHGFIKPKDLIEFIELHRLLGVEIFTMYLGNINSTISNEIRKVIQHYETKNIINLVEWKIPVARKRIWYHGQSLAMNDCLYRNMADFRYLAFIDLDEILVPNGAEMTSWLDMMAYFKKSEQSFDAALSGFTFQSTFFDGEFSRRVLSSEMKTNVHTNRTDSFSIFRNKILVRPDRIFEVGIHHVSKSWPDDAGYSVLKVKPEVARVHHYRTCVLEFGIRCRSRVTDDVIPRKFGQDLENNYQKVLYDIMP